LIYIQKGLAGNQLKRLSTEMDDFERLTTFKPKEISAEEKTRPFNLKGGTTTYAKAKLCNYYISGKMKSPKRIQDNVISRSVITLDYDNDADTPTTLVEMKEAIHTALQAYSYYLYPSTSYTEERPKLRVIVATTRTMNKGEYMATTQHLADLVGLDIDRGSKDFARMFGLPITDDLEEFNRIKFVNQGAPFPVIDAVDAPADDMADLDDFEKMSFQKSRVVSQLETVLEGVGEGRRNNTLASVYGTLIRANMSPSNAVKLLDALNDFFFYPPVDRREFETVIRSVTRTANREEKGGA
jgi:hypothetical protein